MRLPKKYWKMGLKDGWAAFKKKKAATARKLKQKLSTKKKKSTSTKKKTSLKKKTSAKKSISTYRSKTKGKNTMPKKSSYKKPRWSAKKAQEIAIDSIVIGGSAIASTYAINNIPYVKNWKPWQRALTQGTIGILGAIFTPRQHVLVKKFFGGAGVGSVLNFSRQLFPQFSMSGGKSRTLTNNEINHITGNNQNMGVPYNIAESNSMNKSHDMGVPVNLGVPVKLSGRFSRRGNRSYTSSY